MARTSSSNKCVYVDIVDEDGNVIGVAHASECVNNNKFVNLLNEINNLTFDEFSICFFNSDDLDDLKW